MVSRDPSDIPDHMMAGLRRWIDNGVVPGSFLQAVLANDLRDACGQADESNILLLRAYVIFLYNDAPAACWGSPEKMQAWIKHKAAERAQAPGAAA
jgi:hypothetical protein